MSSRHPNRRRLYLQSFELLEARQLFAGFNVSSVPSDGDAGSLRAAIIAANSNGEDDTINLASGVYALSVPESVGENAAATGDLDVTEAGHAITIVGLGATAIDMQLASRIFHVLGTARLTLNNLTLHNGVAQDDGTAGAAPLSTATSLGGAVLAESGTVLTLNNVIVQDCHAKAGTAAVSGRGGGLYIAGSATLNTCNLLANSAFGGRQSFFGIGAEGGGLFAAAGSHVTVSNSNITANSAIGGVASLRGVGGSAVGGGAFAAGDITLTNTKFTANQATAGNGAFTGAGGTAQGAGLYLLAAGTLTDSSFFGNSAEAGDGIDTGGGTGGEADGGGIYVAAAGSITLDTGTLDNNQAVGGNGGNGINRNGSPGGAGGPGGMAQGGGLFALGDTNIRRATLSNNRARGGAGSSGGTGTSPGSNGGGGEAHGGGIVQAGGVMTLLNVTISTNSATGGDSVSSQFGSNAEGGGVAQTSTNNMTLNVQNCTIAANVAQSGVNSNRSYVGGLQAAATNATNNTVVNSILDDNTPVDLFGNFTLIDHTLAKTYEAVFNPINGNIRDQDANLGPLQDHGGPTKTQLPLPGSLAIDAGINSFNQTTDQRGFKRDVGPTDMGAVEVQPPKIGLSGMAIFVENAASVVMAPSAAVTAADDGDFNAGHLKVTITANADVNDRLQIQLQGSGPGQIFVVGSTVFFAGKAIGAFSGGTGSTPLVVSFNTADATKAAVQALVRAIAFRTEGDDPKTATRTVTFVADAGDGHNSDPATATKTIKVTAVNDAPKLAGGGTMSVRLNGTPALIVPTAAATDADSPNLNSGVLTMHFTSGADLGNLLGVSGSFSIDAGNNVKRGSTIIGVRIPSSGGDLIIKFNTSASPSLAQQLLRSITFRATSSTTQRQLAITLTDGDGGKSNTITKTINVS